MVYLDAINIYDEYPNHQPNETIAVQKSTANFNDLGIVSLKTQIDIQDQIEILSESHQTIKSWIRIKIITQKEYYIQYKIFKPIEGWIKRTELQEFLSKKENNVLKVDYSINMIDKGSMRCQIARKYINVPYCWGGKSSYETDCSGLIYQIFREQNIIIPRFSSGQYQCCKLINPRALLPGDLIFVITEIKISDYKYENPIHVCMYLGDENLIESCGLEGIFTTRIISLQEKWNYSQYEITQNLEISENSHLRFGRFSE